MEKYLAQGNSGEGLSRLPETICKQALTVLEWLIDFRYISKHLATRCLAGSAGQNFISSNKKYSLQSFGDLKFNFEFRKLLKESFS